RDACVGVISATDFMRYAEHRAHADADAHPCACICTDWQVVNPEGMPDVEVADLMSRNLFVATPMMNLAELARTMLQAHVHRVLMTPLYVLYSAEFQRVADNLAKNAQDKNLDAAALSYVELTLTCVKCHKHVREVRMARLDVP